MSQIHLLDAQTANSIAAGEVVERPASVVKELVENALDAGASVVTVEIRQGGIRLIRVMDNGGGMDAEDARLAFDRHATSKLVRIEDLDQLLTMGFRGEALASIAAVAQVTLETCQLGQTEGTRIRIAGGEVLEQASTACAAGTSIQVENLFYNVPARFKFLKKDATEAGQITDLLQRLALARPDVSFRLLSNGQNILHTPGNNDLSSTVYAVYGKQTAQACLPIQSKTELLLLTGVVVRPDMNRNTRDQQSFFVNGRLVRSKVMTAALDEAYKTFLMKNKYAIAVLFVDLPPHLVDVNVHPQKMEVRFWNDQEVFRAIYHAVHDAIVSTAGVSSADSSVSAVDASVSSADSSVSSADSSVIQDQAGNVAPDANISPGSYGKQDGDRLDAPDTLILRESNHEPAHTNTGHQESLDLAREQISFVLPTTDTTQRTAVLKVHELARARWIGQVFQTYLLFELDGEVIWIDQHAAHEKIVFERLVERHRLALSQDDADDRLIQAMLVPQVVELSRSEMHFLQSEGDLMHQIGFEYSIIGPSAVALRGLPNTGNIMLQPEVAFRQALSSLQHEDLQREDAIEEVFYSMACQAAVKAHDHLDEREVQQLVDDLLQLDNPYQCPHGRPVAVRMSRHELEKRFKRIV
jgi:DNA mismatch repair protein MutL